MLDVLSSLDRRVLGALFGLPMILASRATFGAIVRRLRVVNPKVWTELGGPEPADVDYPFTTGLAVFKVVWGKKAIRAGDPAVRRWIWIHRILKIGLLSLLVWCSLAFI